MSGRRYPYRPGNLLYPQINTYTVVDNGLNPFDGKSLFLKFTYDMCRNHMVMVIMNGGGDVLETRDVKDENDFQNIYKEIYQHMAKELLKNSNS